MDSMHHSPCRRNSMFNNVEIQSSITRFNLTQFLFLDLFLLLVIYLFPVFFFLLPLLLSQPHSAYPKSRLFLPYQLSVDLFVDIMHICYVHPMRYSSMLFLKVDALFFFSNASKMIIFPLICWQCFVIVFSPK